MKYSENYEFSLPSKADNDPADIDVLSENFEKIDELLKEAENPDVTAQIEEALTQAKESGEFDGERGTGILKVTTAPSSYTTEVDGFTPIYRIALSTVLSQSGVSEVKVGDTIMYSFYQYFVGYVDASYAYIGKSRTSIRGTTGATGATGADGISATHSWNGTTLTVTSASGTSSADLKGEKGADGDDYILTEADKAEIVDDVVAEVPLVKTAEQPTFVNSVDEMTDTSKIYVMPDGFLYAYMLTEKEVETEPTYTNLLPLATNGASGEIFNGTGYKNGWRLNSSGVEKQQDGCGCTGFIPARVGQVIRIKNILSCTVGYGYIHYYTTGYEKVYTSYGITASDFVLNANGVGSFTIPSDKTEVTHIRLSYGTMSADSIITVNEEITESGGTEIVTEYAWVNTGLAFVPADYEDRIIELENKVETLENEVESGVAIVDKSTMFISPDGDDNNDGLTANTPKKTVKACVNAGAKHISAKRGIYKEVVQLWNIGELEIFPTDNNATYAVGEEREPIVFEMIDNIELSNLVAYNSIKRVAYSNSANTQFDKVFTKQSQPPVVSDYGSRYNSTIWLLSEDEKTVCIKLKPVLTVAECEAEANTFTYIGGYIYINAELTNVAKVVVPTNWDSGFYVNGADKITFKEVEVRFSGTYNIDLRNCAFFDLYKCACKYTSYGSGFHPLNSNGSMTACYATKNYDGYGISGYGHTTYIDCVSEFNFDDGMSHHDGTTGTVIGGRYEGNGKGGNTPAYGANVNIYGGLYKNNGMYGIGYLFSSGLEPASGMIQGAVMVGNPIGLAVNANCPVTVISPIFTNNTTDKEYNGIVTEYTTT